MRIRRPRLRDRSLAQRYHVADGELGARLARDGYTVVQVLDDAELETVRSIRERHGAAPGDPATGLFNDTWSTDLDYKRQVSGELADVLTAAMARQLPDHRALGFAHIVKWSGPGGSVVAHRDPTFLDEARFRSLMLWCPLSDVTDADGALWVVPGSHRRASGLRVHQSPENVVEGLAPVAGGPARLLELRAGEGIIYDHALVHVSGPNTGTGERVAVASPLIPRAAQAWYAVPVSDTDAQVVEIDESFFLDHRLCDLDVPRVLEDYPRIGARVHPASVG